MTKDDIIALGYGRYVAESLIRQAKAYMVQQGYEYYKNSRLGRVPVHAIEAILGIALVDMVNADKSASNIAEYS